MATRATTRLSIDDIKLRTGISDAQLDTRIEEDELWELSGLLDSYELYSKNPGFNFNNATIADLKACAERNGHQHAMAEALRKWSNVTSVFTYRSLVEILIKLHKGSTADAVCETGELYYVNLT